MFTAVESVKNCENHQLCMFTQFLRKVASSWLFRNVPRFFWLVDSGSDVRMNDFSVYSCQSTVKMTPIISVRTISQKCCGEFIALQLFLNVFLVTDEGSNVRIGDFLVQSYAKTYVTSLKNCRKVTICVCPHHSSEIFRWINCFKAFPDVAWVAD